MFKSKNQSRTRVVPVVIKRKCKKAVVKQLTEAPDWWVAL